MAGKFLDQIEADWDQFLDAEAGFAVDVVVDGLPIKAIFDREYLSQAIDGISFESSAPVLLCATSDVGTFDHGSVVVGLPESYKVINIRPDQTGETLLFLELQ